MRKAVIASLCAIMAIAVCSCADTDNRYSTAYVCNFMFRGDYHPTSIIARTLSNPGMYVKVTVQKKSGITHLIANPNSGSENEDIALTTEIENRYDYSNVGANQCIIIGCTTTNEWRAYDGQCPYCLESNSGVNFPLTWTNNGQSVECAKCARTYNLNYDGISDDGNRMLQYNVRSNGSVITVNNN